MTSSNRWHSQQTFVVAAGGGGGGAKDENLIEGFELGAMSVGAMCCTLSIDRSLLVGAIDDSPGVVHCVWVVVS